jgi:polyribonucleotide nucleotidyltransferase
MKAVLNFIIYRLEGVLRWTKRIINAVRRFGLLDKTQVDEQLLKIIDFLLEVHPELVKISKEFTRSVLAVELKEHPEVIVELIDEVPTKAIAKLENLVEEQAKAVGDIDQKTFPEQVVKQVSEVQNELKNYTPEQLEKAKVENYLRHGKYELPPRTSPIWHYVNRNG